MTMCALQDGRASAVAGSGKSLALAALPQIRRCEWLSDFAFGVKWLAQTGVVVAGVVVPWPARRYNSPLRSVTSDGHAGLLADFGK